MPKFGTKDTSFGYFWGGIRRQYCHILNQHPRICPIEKFCEKMKMLKFGNENVLLGIFGLEF